MSITAEDLRNCWNVNRGDLPGCISLEVRNRRSLATARVVVVDDLPRWAKAIQRVARSPFTTGRIPTPQNPAGFIANFDWLIKLETLTLIEEGQYDSLDVIPPDTPAPADLTYWGGPKPDYTIPPEVFLRSQIMGRLQRVKEHATRQKSLTPETKAKIELASKGSYRSDFIDDFCQHWVWHGGPHPWATDEQVDKAEQQVVNMRKSGAMHNSYEEFRMKLRKGTVYTGG